MLKPPKDFIPWEYQELIQDFMMEQRRSGIWAPMGFGKTSASLTAIQTLDMIGETEPWLVLAPKRVAESTWPRETQKWTHLRGVLPVSPIIGSVADRRRALKRDAKVYTINYENIPWLIAEIGKGRWPFGGGIVADESTRLKNFRGGFRRHPTSGKLYYQGGGGQRARALGRIAHMAKRFVELTGTPAPNGYKDLWGQLWFLDAGKRLGTTYGAFKERFFTTGFNGFDLEPREGAIDQINALIGDICMSLKIEDWFDVEKPLSRVHLVELPGPSRDIYRRMEREMFTEIEEHGVEAANAAVKTMKCLQLASGAIWIDRDADLWKTVHKAKLEMLDSVHEEINHEPLLVVYQWNHTRDAILRAFPHARVFDGGSTEDEWNAGKIDMMLIHPQSAGHGLNLQDGGNNIAFYDHWWDLELYEQVIERIGVIRQLQSGHSRRVYVRHIVAEGTVDELVMERREGKRSTQEILKDAVRRARR